jgi:hypothetical protein
VDEQPFVFLAFLREAMFLGIHPNIFHVVHKIVFIPYSMVYKSRLPYGLAFFFFPYPLHYVDFYSANHVLDYNVWIWSEQSMPMIRQYHQCRQPKRMKFIDIFENILQFKTKAIIRKNWFPFPGYHSHKIGLVPPVPSFRVYAAWHFSIQRSNPHGRPPYVAALWSCKTFLWDHYQR